MKAKEIIAPIGGWQEKSYYRVEVSMNDSNPIFEAVLFTGFLTEEKQPGAYSFIVAGGCEQMDFSRAAVRFLRALDYLHTEAPTPNQFRLPNDEAVDRSPLNMSF